MIYRESIDKMLVDLVIPVYNEEEELKRNVLKLHRFLSKQNDFAWYITITDNASTDNTPQIGEELANKHKNIKYKRLDKKGRGRAVKESWLESSADILAYMDIDLSTDITHFPNMVKALRSGADIAVGSRLLPGSVVRGRTVAREFISRGLNLLIKIIFQTKFSDAQCGFKAITLGVVQQLLPYVVDDGWFMDSELLIIAEKMGFTIYEEPVVWVDNLGSTVRVLPTAWGDFKGIVRLFITRPWRKVKR